ncbi:transposable element Tcb1 transposase [Trichonephila clavipes]|nr:transposable element Tcb1 transposase [Trichonephila clavipes]
MKEGSGRQNRMTLSLLTSHASVCNTTIVGFVSGDTVERGCRTAALCYATLVLNRVLEPVALPYLQGLATAIFRQDIARSHVSRIVQRFIINHQIELLPWLARSPDLLPIENMWPMVAQQLTQIKPQRPHQINFGNVWGISKREKFEDYLDPLDGCWLSGDVLDNKYFDYEYRDANLIVHYTTPNGGVGGCVIDSTRNGRRDTRCPSARHLAMVREDTGARSEGTTGVWTATNEAVDLRVCVI